MLTFYFIQNYSLRLDKNQINEKLFPRIFFYRFLDFIHKCVKAVMHNPSITRNASWFRGKFGHFKNTFK